MGQLLALVRELEAERVVVGLPLSLSGGDSAQTREAREFAAVLEQRLEDVPVELYDERFTTRARAARRRGLEPAPARERGLARGGHLLSSWLDRHADA